MIVQLLGKPVSEQIYQHIETEWIAYGCPKVTLAIILVGDNPASQSYVKLKQNCADNLGFQTTLHHLPQDSSLESIVQLVHECNKDESITGCLVQLPLPLASDMDQFQIFEAINPLKDVDGFHPINNGRLFLGEKKQTYLLPATAEAVMKVLEFYRIKLTGKHVVVVGVGPIVGRPIVLELLHRNATVTLCHEHTEDLAHHLSVADVVVSATGQAHLIDTTLMKAGSIAIDVGFSKEGTLIRGDIIPPLETSTLQAIAPVPGGVGPVTVAMLMHNLWKAWLLQNKE